MIFHLKLRRQKHMEKISLNFYKHLVYCHNWFPLSIENTVVIVVLLIWLFIFFIVFICQLFIFHGELLVFTKSDMFYYKESIKYNCSLGNGQRGTTQIKLQHMENGPMARWAITITWHPSSLSLNISFKKVTKSTITKFCTNNSWSNKDMAAFSKNWMQFSGSSSSQYFKILIGD